MNTNELSFRNLGLNTERLMAFIRDNKDKLALGKLDWGRGLEVIRTDQIKDLIKTSRPGQYGPVISILCDGVKYTVIH